MASRPCEAVLTKSLLSVNHAFTTQSRVPSAHRPLLAICDDRPLLEIPLRLRREGRLRRRGFRTWNCTILFGRHKLDAEDWVCYFKRAASRELRKANLHLFERYVNRTDNHVPTPWVEGGWKVCLHDDDEILRTIRYINENPVKAGLPAQQWDYVSPFTPSVCRRY